jgi:PEP-CTERM motif
MRSKSALFSILILFASAHAVTQPSQARCDLDNTISSCRGNETCIREAQERQRQCSSVQSFGAPSRAVVVPEPASALLLGTALLGLAFSLRKRKTKQR